MARSFFITSSGTDTGKTFVCSAMLAYARAQKCAFNVVKPVVSGVDGFTDDATTLLHVMRQPLSDASYDAISPWRYKAPLSPHRAAELENNPLDIDALVRWCKRWQTKGHSGLIEGVGGVMVPLDYKHTVCDWIVALEMPVIIVLGDYLGSISHGLSALEALHCRNIRVEAVVVNTSSVSVEHDNMVRTIKAFSPYDCDVYSLSRMEEKEREQLAQGALDMAGDFCAQNSRFFRFVDSLLHYEYGNVAL